MCGCEPSFVCSTHRVVPDYRCDHFTELPDWREDDIRARQELAVVQREEERPWLK